MMRRTSLLFQTNNNFHAVDNLTPSGHTSTTDHSRQHHHHPHQNDMSDNAFASAVSEAQYDVMEENDARHLLSQAIQQHASTIHERHAHLEIEDLDELEGGGEMAPVSSGPVSEPPPSSIVASILGSRLFTSIVGGESTTNTNNTGEERSLRPNFQRDNSASSRSMGDPHHRPSHHRNSSMSLSGSHSSMRDSGSSYSIIYPFETRKAILTRLAVCVGCFVFSLLLSFLIGGGSIGQQMASHYYFNSIKVSNDEP